MKLLTKYNIGDVVYYFDNNLIHLKKNLIKKLCIFKIKIIVRDSRNKQIHYDGGEIITEIFYKGFTEEERCIKEFKHKWISEKYLYPNKKDLIVSMQEDLNYVINYTHPRINI